VYTVRGINAIVSSANTENPDFVWNFWNPHSTQRIRVYQICMTMQGGATASPITLSRTTTQGTGATSVTAGIQNHSERGVSPPSGPMLQLSDFAAAKPTEDSATAPLYGTTPTGSEGSIMQWEFETGLAIPPGSGLAAVLQSGSDMPAFENVIVWDEDR
jgi:hypothetical protein